jgi:hypothetical protein
MDSDGVAQYQKGQRERKKPRNRACPERVKKWMETM